MAVVVPRGAREEARAAMLELFPEGFEERGRAAGVELAAYTDAAGEASGASGIRRHRGGPTSPRAGRIAGASFTTASGSARSGSARPGRSLPRARRRSSSSPAVRSGPVRIRRRGSASSCSELSAGSLLDVGCGSGVLAIAAAKLGFSPVHALDDDPVGDRGDDPQRGGERCRDRGSSSPTSSPTCPRARRLRSRTSRSRTSARSGPRSTHRGS